MLNLGVASTTQTAKRPLEVFHALGSRLRLAVAQAQCSHTMEEAATPAPGPQRTVLIDLGWEHHRVVFGTGIEFGNG